MSIYMIHRRRPCQACKCTGYVEHSGWTEFYSHPENESLTPDETEAWFIREGWVGCPPEEVECWECDGQGYIHEDVDAEHFIQYHDLMTRSDVETMLEALAATFRRTIAEIPA